MDGGGGVTQAIQEDASNTTAACEAEWIGVLGQLRAEVGEAAFRNWLQPMNLEYIDSGQAVIAAPTRFLRDWVATHYADRLLALWRAENEQVKRLLVVVVAPSGPTNGNHFPGSDDDAEAVRPCLLLPDLYRRSKSAMTRRSSGSRSPLRFREFRRRQAQRARPRRRAPCRRGLRVSGYPGAVQPVVSVWRRRARQDASDARCSLARPQARLRP